MSPREQIKELSAEILRVVSLARDVQLSLLEPTNKGLPSHPRWTLWFKALEACEDALIDEAVKLRALVVKREGPESRPKAEKGGGPGTGE